MPGRFTNHTTCRYRKKETGLPSISGNPVTFIPIMIVLLPRECSSVITGRARCIELLGLYHMPVPSRVAREGPGSPGRHESEGNLHVFCRGDGWLRGGVLRLRCASSAVHGGGGGGMRRNASGSVMVGDGGAPPFAVNGDGKLGWWSRDLLCRLPPVSVVLRQSSLLLTPIDDFPHFFHHLSSTFPIKYWMSTTVDRSWYKRSWYYCSWLDLLTSLITRKQWRSMITWSICP